MSYVPRTPSAEAAEASRRFIRWVKGKTAEQIRREYLKGAPPGGTVVAELGAWIAEAGRLRARLADREARLREIKATLRAHQARITVTSGTRYVIHEMERRADLRQPLPDWVRLRNPLSRRTKRTR